MSDQPAATPEARRRWVVILPLLIFAALSMVFLVQLLSGRDESLLPSALIGTKAPETDLPPVEGIATPGLNTGALKGRIVLLNVWASWCIPCRQEHALLMEMMNDDRFVLAGLNYKDDPANARRFLGELGNPFEVLGADRTGRAAINWGVYGVPETYLIGKDGTILWKQVGPFTTEAIRDQLIPRVEKAFSAQ